MVPLKIGDSTLRRKIELFNGGNPSWNAPHTTLLKYKYKYKYEITPLGMFHPTLLKYKYKCYTNPICMIPIPTLLKQPLDS